MYLEFWPLIKRHLTRSCKKNGEIIKERMDDIESMCGAIAATLHNIVGLYDAIVNIVSFQSRYPGLYDI